MATRSESESRSSSSQQQYWNGGRVLLAMRRATSGVVYLRQHPRFRLSARWRASIPRAITFFLPYRSYFAPLITHTLHPHPSQSYDRQPWLPTRNHPRRPQPTRSPPRQQRQQSAMRQQQPVPPFPLPRFRLSSRKRATRMLLLL